MDKKLTFECLDNLYIRHRRSVLEIAKALRCSENKINYWLAKYDIPKRTISEAIYIKNNPKGDPFKVKKRFTREDLKLVGLGLGLYWGEGHRKNKVSIRLGNTDPALIRYFMKFLVDICGTKKKDIGFHLMIFSDINPIDAKRFWIRELKINQNQIKGKITVLKSGRVGAYRQKSKYGVIILEYHNKKLRDIILNMIDGLR